MEKKNCGNGVKTSVDIDSHSGCSMCLRWLTDPIGRM